jgi:hypothetical protein
MLCQCLTLERLSQCPSYANWTVVFGRLQCLYQVLSVLEKLMSKLEIEALYEKNGHESDDFIRNQEKSIQIKQQYRKKWLDRVNGTMNRIVADNHSPHHSAVTGLLNTVSLSLAYQQDWRMQFMNENNSSSSNADTSMDYSAASTYGNVNFDYGCVVALKSLSAQVEDVISSAPSVEIHHPLANVMFSQQAGMELSAVAHHHSAESRDNRQSFTADVSFADHSGFDASRTSAVSSSHAAKKPKPVAWTVEVQPQQYAHHHPTGESQYHVSRDASSVRSSRETVDDTKANVSRTVQNVSTLEVPKQQTPREAQRDNSKVVDQSLTELEINARNRDKLLSEMQQQTPLPSTTSRTGASRQGNDSARAEQGEAAGSRIPSIRQGHQQAPALTGESRIADDDRSAFSNATQQSARSQQSHFSRQSSSDTTAQRASSTKPDSIPSHTSKQRQQAPASSPLTAPPAAKCETLTPTVLFESDCPLRCAIPLTMPDRSRSSSSLQLSCDSVAVGSNSKSVHIVSLSGAETNVFTNVHNGSVYAMDWTYTSNVLITASNDKTIRLIRLVSSMITLVWFEMTVFIFSVIDNSTSAPLKGHNGTIRVVRAQSGASCGISTDEEGSGLFGSGGAGDNKVRIWDMQTG